MRKLNHLHDIMNSFPLSGPVFSVPYESSNPAGGAVKIPQPLMTTGRKLVKSVNLFAGLFVLAAAMFRTWRPKPQNPDTTFVCFFFSDHGSQSNVFTG